MDRPLILDRYRPLGTSGSGATATVEVAWDTRIQRRVAIKRVFFNGSQEAMHQTLAEARTAAMLSNPSIVSVLDFEVEDGEALLFMEYVDGETLAQLLKRQDGPLSLNVIAAVTHAIVDALDYAHENQVLHLDIKPENVLIGRNGTVKVSDFGVAALSGSQGFSTARGGTIGYMPPEQIAGRSVDERTDEWALASVIYEMLTGCNPFAATDLRSAYQAVCTADVPLPSAVRDDVGPAIDAVLLDALSPAPEVRYPSVAAFAVHLEPCLGSIRQGRAELRELLEEPESEAVGLPKSLRRAGFWERQSPRSYNVLRRVVSAAGSAWLAWVGFSPLSLSGNALLVVIVAFAACAAIVPRLGAVLAPLAVGAGAVFAGVPTAGAAIITATLLWWLASGRRDEAGAALMLASPLLGVAHLPCLIPLLAGFCLPARRAVACALFSSLLYLACMPLTGSTSMYALGILPIGDARLPVVQGAYAVLASAPRTWIVLGGWVLAALVASALDSVCRRGPALGGAALGSLIMLAAQLSAQKVAAGGIWTLPQGSSAVCILVSFAVMGTIGMFGPPVRGGSEIDADKD